ncbi:mucin-2-like [Pantherophis guttatus]|uniref:Mucin-2-like n=1 Tax=Pantherophis guttatus TaxID=94885 RepID=A0A6P9D2W8_PANGU|nr:mucin-2-like [Pantherophis guttatus]
MDHLLGLCTLFPLFLSTFSNFCGLQYPDPKLDKANVISEYSGATEAPWLVNIYGNGQRCQGVILSSFWVLTAANCFLLMNPSQVELTGSPGHLSTMAVSQFLLHRGFSSRNTAPNNDLGLILLAQPVDLTAKDMWPACIPQEKKPYNTQEECRIFERGQEGSMKWFLKETMVEALSIADCSKHWPNATEGRNLCVAKKHADNLTTCKVPVGSPVICHDPVTWEWEVMGLVSQSLHNCTIPILASQLLSHTKWLKQEGALENPLQTQDKLPSAAGQQQPVTSLEPTTVQTPSATLQVPVILPAAKQIVKLPSSEASLPPVQAITAAAPKLSSINLPSLEATVAAILASSPTKPPTLETIAITEATKLPPVEAISATVIELPPTNLPLLEAIIAATAASPLIKPPALETITVTEATKPPSMETTTATAIELPSTSKPLEATMAATTTSPLTKPPVPGTITITEATKLPSMETTTTTITKLPTTSLPSLGATTAATTASPPSSPPALKTITTTEAPPVEKNMTTRISLTNQTAKQLGAVSSTTKNSTLRSSKAENPAQETNDVKLTTAHESSPTTSASFSSTTKPQHGAPTSSGRLLQETPSIPGQPTTTQMASTKYSFTPSQQSSVISMTSPQLSSVVSPLNKRSSVTMGTTKSFAQTPKQQNKKLDLSPQATSSITSKPSARATQTLVTSTTRQSLQTSLINNHHHIVIIPPTYLRQSKPLSSPGTR